MAEDDKTIEIVEISGDALTKLKAHAYAELAKARPADGTPKLAETKTPWAVICREHGQQFVTKDEYMRQLCDPDARWACPRCGEVAEFDDDTYEEAMEADDQRLHDEDCEADCSCKGDSPDA